MVTTRSPHGSGFGGWPHGGIARGGEAAWYRSLDLDRLPLRAPFSADRIIRQVAAETGATLVDLEASYGPWADPRWFVDTLHPSAQGARIIAARLAPVVRRELGLPAARSPAGRQPTGSAPNSPPVPARPPRE